MILQGYWECGFHSKAFSLNNVFLRCRQVGKHNEPIEELLEKPVIRCILLSPLFFLHYSCNIYAFIHNAASGDASPTSPQISLLLVVNMFIW